MMTIAAAVTLGLLLPGVVLTVLRRPTLRRLALGNVRRRAGESALVIGGALLATALITASFLIGESFGGAVRSLAVNELGPVDEIVNTDTRSEAAAVAEAITAADIDGVDGVLPATLATLGMSAATAGGATVGELVVGEADLAELIAFGGRPGDTGLDVPGLDDPASLPADAAIVSQRIATDLSVGVGDEVVVHAGALDQTARIVAIAEDEGLGGFAEVWLPAGTLTSRLVDADDLTSSRVLVSNEGGVLDGADRSESVVAAIESVLAGLGSAGGDPTVRDVKAGLLEAADDEAAENTTLFATVGGFSVAAGILLVVNLFVMLAEERTVELGTLRAIGFDRRRVSLLLRVEGAIYGLAAALLGAIAGIGVAAGVMWATSSLLVDDPELTVSLSVPPTALISGVLIGFAISQLTVSVTSFRIARRNVIASLKQLPPPPLGRPGRLAIAAGLVTSVVGGVLYAIGSGTGSLLILGPVLGLVGLVPLAARFIGRAPAAIGLGLAASVWPPAAFTVHETTMMDADVDVFLTLGLSLVALAALVLSHAGPIWRAILGRLGGGLAARIGFAHPLARPGRTAMLVSMYALILFTVTFMASINSVFSAQVPAFARSAGGDWTGVVDTNRAAGLTADDVAGQSAVEAVAEVRLLGLETTAVIDGTTEVDDWRRATGVDASFLERTGPELQDRDPGFSSDEAVWAAVVEGAAVVTPGIDEGGWEVGTMLTLAEPEVDGGPSTTLVVAGNYRFGWSVGSGLFVPRTVADELVPDRAPNVRFYVAGDAASIVTSIDEGLVTGGAETTTFLAAAEDEVAGQQSFIRLLQGYLAGGLLIGIAGLAVVLIRAVRERRRQLGTMRALGVPAALVERSFLIEGAFIGVQGVVVGIGLGLLSAWQILIGTSSFEAELTWRTPWVSIAVLVVVAVGASILAALGPARRAAAITPAVALRLDH